MPNRTTRKMKVTKVEDLRPFVKVVLDGDMSVTVEDNLPDDYKGRSMAASLLYGAFQAVANEAAKLEPKIELPSTEQVSKILTARS